jgi:hypothetical protein
MDRSVAMLSDGDFATQLLTINRPVTASSPDPGLYPRSELQVELDDSSDIVSDADNLVRSAPPTPRTGICTI